MKKILKVAMFLAITVLSTSIYAGQGVLVSFVNRTNDIISIAPALLDPSNPDSYRDWWYENDLGDGFQIAAGETVEKYTETKVMGYMHDGIIRVKTQDDITRNETVMEIFTGHDHSSDANAVRFQWYEPIHVVPLGKISVSYYGTDFSLSYGFTNSKGIQSYAQHIEYRGADIISIRVEIVRFTC